MSYFQSRRPLTAALVVVGAILTLGAASAGASGALVAYNVYPLVSDGTAVTAPLADGSLVNGWGLSATATSPWWISNNKTNNSTLYTGVGSKNATVVTVPGGPDGHGREPEHDRLRGQPGRRQRSLALPVRHGPDRSSAGRRRSTRPNAVVAVDNSAAGADYHRSRDRERPAVRRRLPQRARRLRSTPRSSRSSLGFTDSEHPQGLGAVRHPGSEREHLRHLCPAGRDSGKTPVPGGGLGYVDEFTPGRHARRAGRVEGHDDRAPLNAPWGLAMAPGELRRLQRRPARRQLRERPDQRLQQRSTDDKWVYKGQLRVASGSADRDRRPVGDRLRQRRLRRARRTTCTSPRARAERRTACSASSPSAS